MKPIILAGGSGSRLWPKSRLAMPKQFLPLISKDSLLQDTLKRLTGTNAAEPMIICNEAHRFLVAEQSRQINIAHSGIILEPIGRNTAPAIALAALKATEGEDDPLLLILAADHVIQNQVAFHASLNRAQYLAEKGKLVTFGILPDKPHTGYGYIKKGASLLQDELDVGFEVSKFVEKPDLAAASTYIDSGDYLWNSGMFMFKASVYLRALEEHTPEILAVCKESLESQTQDMDFTRVDADIFVNCPDVSIDYAVMEHTHDAAVVMLDANWSDIGSWSSLWESTDKDINGNACMGDVMLQDTTNSYINAEGKLVSVIGLNNIVVVETKDAVMVAHKDKVQDIKYIVQNLKAQKRPEYQFHREVFRPWGSYDLIDHGERFQVKRITVIPGEKLSLQMHYHRAEHWIIVSGIAKVTIGDKTLILSENESTYIPIGQMHALENPGDTPLELIEVQSGSYLGEDDIVRFSDRYGRTD